MYSWAKMKNLKRSFHAKLRKVEISLILIRGMFSHFEDSDCGMAQINGVYEGEIGKALYERGKNHIPEFNSGLQSNCVAIHNFRYHNWSKTLDFRMEGLRKL